MQDSSKILDENYRKLDFADKQIGPKQLKKILEVINEKAKSHNKYISHLNLNNNNLGEQGIMIMNKWLKQ